MRSSATHSESPWLKLLYRASLFKPAVFARAGKSIAKSVIDCWPCWRRRSLQTAAHATEDQSNTFVVSSAKVVNLLVGG